jgi:hypothetical protein
MQIQFDPRDRNACAAVIAAVIALHGDLPYSDAALASAGDDEHDPIVGVNAATGELVHASEVFDAPDPAAAFPPAAAAPIAPPATAAPLPPVGTQGDGTAATTPPVGSDNGQAAPPTASPSSVELDAKGLPWDARIHAGKANAPIKVGDGSWRKKRGVDAALVTQVEAELRQIMAAPGPNGPAATPPAVSVSEPSPAPSPPPPAVASPEPAPAPAPTAAPVAPVPTPPVASTEHGPAVVTPAADEPITLPVLMRKITALQSAGALSVADTNAVAVSLGLTSVRDLVQRPDLIASFDALLPASA